MSKAALDRMVDGWRMEHPGVRFSSIVLGPIASRNDAPGTFAAGWDAAKAAESIQTWTSLGLIGEARLDSAELCEQVIAILETSASVPRVVLEP